MARLNGAAAALVAFLHAAPAWAEAGGRLGGGGALNISLTRIMLALLLCLMLAALAGLLLKRGGGKVDLRAVRRLVARLPTERRIEVVESRRISQHADLCLLRCDGEEYLILSSAAQQAVLRQGPAAASSTGPSDAAA